MFARGRRVRRGGRIVELQDTPRATADFGDGRKPTIAVSWGDIATAWHSTQIPSIEVFFEASPQLQQAARLPSVVRRLLATGFAQRLIKNQIDRRMPPGPTPKQRSRGKAVLIAEAWDAAGGGVGSRLQTPEAYTLTAQTAVEIARRAASVGASPGYQTPSTAFSADFVLQFDGVTRSDLG